MGKNQKKNYKQIRLDDAASDILRDAYETPDTPEIPEKKDRSSKVSWDSGDIGTEKRNPVSDKVKKRRNEKLVFSEFDNDDIIVGYSPDEPEPEAVIDADQRDSSLEWEADASVNVNKEALPKIKRKNTKLTLEGMPEKKKAAEASEFKPEKNAKLTLDGMPEKKQSDVVGTKSEKKAKLTLGEAHEEKKADPAPKPEKSVHKAPDSAKKAEKAANAAPDSAKKQEKAANAAPDSAKKQEKAANAAPDSAKKADKAANAAPDSAKKQEKAANAAPGNGGRSKSGKSRKSEDKAERSESSLKQETGIKDNKTEETAGTGSKNELSSEVRNGTEESKFEIPMQLEAAENSRDETPGDTKAAAASEGGDDRAEAAYEETEDDAISDELAASIRAAMAEKAATGSVSRKPDSVKPAVAARKTKNKAPDTKPLKPILSIANIMYSAIVFGAVAIAFLALPRSGVSATEQRELAKFPAIENSDIMNGEYTIGITDYFNDNIPYRDELKKAAAQLRGLFGISYNNAEIIGPVAVVTEEPEMTPAETTTMTAETTTAGSVPDVSASAGTTAAVTEPSRTTVPETTTKPVETTKNLNEIADGVVTNGQVVTKLSDGHWWGISLFGGGNGTTYANAVNRFKRELGDSVNVYSMPIPTSGEYYLPDAYAQYNASHQKSIDAINSQLQGVIPVPAVTALWEHIDEPIYTRTDHHWQALGAYYAAKCFAETAGVPFADISTMERVDIPGYMGTMYGFTESANLLSDPEVFTYYKPSNNYKTYYYDTAYNYSLSFPFFIPMPVNGSYSTFMGADNKIVRIKTDAGTGRKLVVFKDSYGNAEIPFYFGSFDEIYVCDMRYFDLNGVQFVKFTGATDLLFTECTFSAVGTNANGLETILSNPETQITEGADS